MAERDLDWWLERTDVARWSVETPGARDVHVSCPACGSVDNLHLTEKRGGRTVDHCWTPGCTHEARLEALEAGADPEPTPDEGSGEADAPIASPRIRRLRRSGASSAPAPQVGDPMDWYSAYTGIDRAWIEELGVDGVTDQNGGSWVRHYWDGLGIYKLRQCGTDVRVWEPKGASPPILWPHASAFPLEPEIWLAEGETDAIVLRQGYNLPAYTAGSASTLPGEHEFRLLHSEGVDRVVVAYDNDKAGRKAQKELVDAARAAGLLVSVAEPGHPIYGGPKDWRERWLANPDPRDVPRKGSAASSIDIWALADVTPSVELPLLAGRIDPEDHTILFGDGGSGKGMVAAWWSSQLARDGMKILVLDYERHAAGEWRKRIERFGGLEGVDIVQSSQPIWDIAHSVREAVLERSYGLVVVDSALYACIGVDAYKPEGATMYSQAIAQWPCPTLTLAHKTKAKDDTLKYPFGTVFWHNGARLTVSIDADGYDTPRKLHTVKANHGDAYSIEIDWSWVGQGLPHQLVESDVQADTATTDLMVRAEIPEDGAEVATGTIKSALEGAGVELRGNALSKSLQRLQKGGLIKQGSTRGTWVRTVTKKRKESEDG